MEITFRPMTSQDWSEVARIYKEGIATGIATFEQVVPSWKIWDTAHINACRIIAIVHNEIAGWAALSAVSGRSVYAGVAEVSVYVSDLYRGQKIGKELLGKLIDESEKENFWTLQSSVFPENKASLNIHKQLGFREMGYRERIGKMNGKWRNTILLERRSNFVGIEE